MSSEPTFERSVDPTPAPLADGGARPPAAAIAVPAAGPGLAAELKATGDWRRTSLGPNADLSGVDLSGADLRGVDFTNARLTGARFTNANLIGAQFAWAQLEHADFTGAIGVVGPQFARADLAGSQMPASVKFGAFDTANEVAQSTGKLFSTVLLVCVYSGLTINSTIDAKLLTDSATSKLPILNADIPIINFYALVPAALVIMAVIAMLQMQRVWIAMAAAPAALPDTTTMADRASTWVFGAWAAARVEDQSQVGPLARVQAWLWALVGWWSVPATIAWFWVRYLHHHDSSITILQVVALSVACATSAASLTLASVTLPRRWTPRRPRRDAWRPYVPAAVVAVVIPFLFGFATHSAINGPYRHGSYNAAMSQRSADEQPANGSLARTTPAWEALGPALLSAIGVNPVAQLSESEVSTRLTTTPGVADTGETTPDPKASGARLVGTNLRFASAERVFLALADLRSADLLGADLYAADLRGANLAGASLVGSLLYDADLRKVRSKATPTAERLDSAAHIVYADTLFCQRTSFAGANLRYARFDLADVRGASFDNALVQGASFRKARLQRATFYGADLDDADFRGAVVSAAQILQAHHRGAMFSDSLIAELRRLAPTDSDFAHYDLAAIQREADATRASGESEPDTLDASALRSRDSVISAAFHGGPAGVPSAGAIDHWRATGRTAPGSANAIPDGCLQVSSRHPTAH